MFQFARTSAKAVLVAASAAGFVAFGAGIASADVVDASVPSGTVDQVQREAPVPGVAHTLPAPAAEVPATPSRADVENTLGDAAHTVGVDKVHQSAPGRGAVHHTVNTLPLPEKANGTAHRTVNTAMRGADNVDRLANELPEAPGVKVPGSNLLPKTDSPVSGVPGSLLPKPVADTAEQAAGAAPEVGDATRVSPDEAADTVSERGTEVSGAANGTVEGTTDRVSDAAPVDAPDVPGASEVPDVTETAGEASNVNTDDVTGTVQDVDPGDTLSGGDTPVL